MIIKTAAARVLDGSATLRLNLPRGTFGLLHQIELECTDDAESHVTTTVYDGDNQDIWDIGSSDISSRDVIAASDPGVIVFGNSKLQVDNFNAPNGSIVRAWCLVDTDGYNILHLSGPTRMGGTFVSQRFAGWGQIYKVEAQCHTAAESQEGDVQVLYGDLEQPYGGDTPNSIHQKVTIDTQLDPPFTLHDGFGCEVSNVETQEDLQTVHVWAWVKQ